MSNPEMRFHVAFPQPENHVYEVTLELDGLDHFPLTLSMPIWTPGHYSASEFARHVFDLKAGDGSGAALDVRKIRKDAFEIAAPGPSGKVVVTYRVYAHEFTVNAAHLTAEHAYWNGAALFLGIDGRTDIPARVSVDVPIGWHISTGLPHEPSDPHTLVAESFDLLVDSPVEVGTHRSVEFEALGKAHELAIYGHGNEDAVRFTEDVKRIVEAEGKIFGGLPYSRYVFLIHLTDGKRGGLEHLYSTTCDMDRLSFRPASQYRKVLDLIAHEFFHLWNVKRIHPQALGPFDYRSENYTRLLWAMEGITDYYSLNALRRADLITPRAYLKELAERIRRYEGTPGRFVQSASDASFDTWVKFYRPDEDTPNRTISYYLKGDLLGLGLDLLIRHVTGGQNSLDDVMRILWSEWGSRGVGFPESEWRKAAERVAGQNLGEFFDRYVDGTELYDLAEFLSYAGLTLRRTHTSSDPDSDDDSAADADHPPTGDLGLALDMRQGRLTVRHVFTDGACANADIAPGDELIALAGYRVADVKNVEDRLTRMDPGDKLSVDYVKDGVLKHASVALTAARPQKYRIVPLDHVFGLERTIYEQWLGVAFQRTPNDVRTQSPV